MKSRILLVEDERGIALVVSDLLRAEGHTVEVAQDGKAGLERALNGKFDLLVLDVMLPGLNGTDLCQCVREQGFDGAILMLSARSQLIDRVNGLRKGADDYLIKPFEPAELAARAEALLRRVRKTELTPVIFYKFGNITADFTKSEFHKNGESIGLAAKEIELLRFMVRHRDQDLTREEILNHVWRGQKFITPRTVDVHVAWLRQKLEEDPQSPKFIRTVRGVGYRFTP